MLRFTEEHEWLRQDGDEVVVGITEYAAEQLGDLVFIELPEEGRIVAKGDHSDSVFFLQRGMVSVKLADGVRLATLVPGTAFGELALIGGQRSADVFADNPVLCRRIALDTFDAFRARRPAAAELIMRNLAHVLAHRLLQANTKIDLLSAN